MTVETTVSRAGPYAGAGTVGPFPVPFRFLENAHLRLIKTLPDGTNSDLVLDVDYSVAGAGDDTGSVTLTAPLFAQYKLTILRNVPATQEADYVENDSFPAESHERALDKLTMIVQQQGESLGRALTVPATDPSVSLALPGAALRARRYLSFDNSGRPVATTFDIDTIANLSQEAVQAAANAKASEISAASSANRAQELSGRVEMQVEGATPSVKRFSGTGAQTSFDLGVLPGAEENTQVYISGVYQQKDTYSVVDTNLVFSSAPPVGADNIEVVIAPHVALAQATAEGVSINDGGVIRSIDSYVKETRSDVNAIKLNEVFLASNYAALDSYSGDGSVVDIVGVMGMDRPSGFEGRFLLSPADPSVTPNGGTIRRLADGRIARRSYSGAVLTSWWGNDHTAAQSAINAAYGKTATVLINTHQIWTAPVILKNGIKLRGLGADVMGGGGTKITYTGSTDALLLQNTVNGSTSANIDIEGIWFVAFSLADNCGVIFDTASSVLKIRKCRFNAKNCIILDQTEISDIYDCSFAIGDGDKHCGVWIVNGPDKNPGAAPFYTNRISVKNCEFNGGAGSVFIWDDGGVNHAYVDNNYNGGGTHIIATGVNSLTISRGEYEVNSGPAIIFGLSKRNGGAGSKCHAVIVSGAYYWAQIDVPFIASVAGAIGHLDVITNFINCPGTVFSGLNVACDSLCARGNEQLGAGDGNTVINNYYDNVPATTSWSAETASVIGDGVLAATKSRKGREVTYRLILQFGDTTTPGTGAWSFTLPHKANTQSAAFTVGSAYALIIGTSGYVLAASITPDGVHMQIQTNNATPNAGAGIPAVWSVGSSLKAQITYEADALI